MLVASKFNKIWPSIVFGKRGLSESAVILVAMPTAMGETLHGSPRNAGSFGIKRRAFRLVPPDGRFFVLPASATPLRPLKMTGLPYRLPFRAITINH